MKIQKLHRIITKIYENHNIPIEINENHKNLRIPFENHEKHEDHRIHAKPTKINKKK